MVVAIVEHPANISDAFSSSVCFLKVPAEMTARDEQFLKQPTALDMPSRWSRIWLVTDVRCVHP